ncbi:MAG: TerB family tellurite resistance protein [Lactobacillaceae bacterium]|nr:TerB family tellurite resistance protein [Lactobacillaceae bacterium]
MFWGLCLGHLLVDRTIIIKYLYNKLSEWDDDVRLLMPYRFYRFYDLFLSPMFGKIWGVILGSVTYGWIGFAIGAVIGHFAFDSDNDKVEKLKAELDKTFRENIFLLLGFTIGYTLNNKIITFTGMILGLSIDLMRSDTGLVSRLKLGHITSFWPRINVLKLSLNSPEAKKAALVKSMAGLSAKLAKAEGEVTENEIKVFKRLFNISSNDDISMKIFNKAKTSSENYEEYAKQLKYIAGDDIELKEDIIENLFEIAAADGDIVMEELNMLKDITKIIEFPDGNFEVVRKRYEIINNCSDYKDYYKVLGLTCGASNKEIRETWRRLTTSCHPDKIIAGGGTDKDIRESTALMAEINEAYQQIMKQRKAS